VTSYITRNLIITPLTKLVIYYTCILSAYSIASFCIIFETRNSKTRRNGHIPMWSRRRYAYADHMASQWYSDLSWFQ